MDLGLSGRRAVVTGGSAGIGAAVVSALAAEGCDVFFCGRSQDRIDAFLARHGASASPSAGRVAGRVVDVGDRAAVAAWFAEIGRADVVVANVSALSADWTASLDADLAGTRNVVEAAEPLLAASPVGAFTYVGSKAASFATPGFESYGAVKAAMAHYMKSLAKRLVAAGVRVNVVSPGDTFVEGGFWDGIRSAAPEVYDATVAANPMGRLGRPEEVAAVVAFVSSPAASFVAGANWYVDGGAVNHVQY